MQCGRVGGRPLSTRALEDSNVFKGFFGALPQSPSLTLPKGREMLYPISFSIILFSIASIVSIASIASIIFLRG
jgi:hypothetical protein